MWLNFRASHNGSPAQFLPPRAFRLSLGFSPQGFLRLGFFLQDFQAEPREGTAVSVGRTDLNMWARKSE